MSLATLGIVAGTIALVVGLVWWGRRGLDYPGELVVTGLGSAALIASAVVELGPSRWGYPLALLPAGMIALHAVYLRQVRRRALPRTLEPERHKNHESFEKVVASHQRDYSTAMLLLRFGVPAAMTFGICILLFHTLGPGRAVGRLTEDDVHAATYGALGAYVYVVMLLGRRASQRDITASAAMWCVVSLAVGPLLAVTLSKVFFAKDVEGWTPKALFFFAGLAPREVAAFLEDRVRRTWITPDAAATANRIIPLTRLHGMDSETISRLDEEGYRDVHGLAYADPFKLLRNTNFDQRRILAWMDEALLIALMPDHWELLEKAGMTGAIDLAAAYDRRDGEHSLEAFIKAGGMKEDIASVIRTSASNVAEDRQVSLVWDLYGSVPDSADGDAGEEVPPVAPVRRVSGGASWLMVATALAILAALSGQADIGIHRVSHGLVAALLAGAAGLIVQAIALDGWATPMLRVSVGLVLAAVGFGAALRVWEGIATGTDQISVQWSLVSAGCAAVGVAVAFEWAARLKSRVRFVVPAGVGAVEVEVGGRRSVVHAEHPELFVARGEHEITVRADGHVDYRAAIDTTARASVTLPPMQPLRTVFLRVLPSTAPNVRVFLGGRRIAAGMITFPAACTAKLLVMADGHKDEELEVAKIPEGSIYAVTLAAETPAKPAAPEPAAPEHPPASVPKGE